MAYKEIKLTKEAASAFYNGLNAGFDKKKKSSAGGVKKTTAKSTSKSKKK